MTVKALFIKNSYRYPKTKRKEEQMKAQFWKLESKCTNGGLMYQT